VNPEKSTTFLRLPVAASSYVYVVVAPLGFVMVLRRPFASYAYFVMYVGVFGAPIRRSVSSLIAPLG
jgi:hypothetical protein